MNESQLSAELANASALIFDAVAHLEAALRTANSVQRPEGRTIGDKATAAYLAGCLEQARKLESALAQITE